MWPDPPTNHQLTFVEITPTGFQALKTKYLSSTSFANILHYMVSMYFFFFFFGVLNHTGLYLLGTRVILLLLLVIPHSHNFRGNCRNKLHPSAGMAFVLFS